MQRLDFFFGVVPLRAVLYDEHADDLAASENRHAHQRLVDFFAGLRPVGKARMRLRIGEIEWARMSGDVADETFADLEARRVNGGRFQALGCGKFKLPRTVHQIDGAHFRHHVGSDQHDNLVEPLLRAFRLRHDLAQTTEQNARTTDGARHQLRSRLLRNVEKARVTLPPYSASRP